MDNHGIAIANMAAFKNEKGQVNFMISTLSPDLDNKWRTSLPYDPSFQLLKMKWSAPFLVLYFQDEKKLEHAIYTIDPETGSFGNYFFSTPAPFSFSEIVGSKNRVWITGLIRENGVILEFDLQEGRYRTLPTSFQTKVLSIENLSWHEDEKSLTFLMRIKRNRLFTYILRTLYVETDRFEDIALPETRFNLAGLKVNTTNNSFLLSGIYYRSDATNTTGIYLCSLGDSVIHKFYPWKEFEGLRHPYQVVHRSGEVKLGELRTKKSNSRLFLVESVQPENGMFTLTSKVFAQAYRSKNLSERDLERQDRNNRINRNFGGRYFFTYPQGFNPAQYYSATELLEARYMDFLINQLVSEGLDYEFTHLAQFDDDLNLLSSASVAFPGQKNAALTNNVFSVEGGAFCYPGDSEMMCLSMTGENVADWKINATSYPFQRIEFHQSLGVGRYLIAGPGTKENLYRIQITF